MKWFWLVVAAIVILLTSPICTVVLTYYDMRYDRRTVAMKLRENYLTKYTIAIHKKACEAFGRTQFPL